MTDITDLSNNYAGNDHWHKLHTLDVEVMKVGGTQIKTPVLSGEYTTTGWAATEAATIVGVLVGDIVIASLKDNWTNNVTLLTSTENTADTIDFTFSADPGNDAIVSYIVLR